jgi:hypothetical protein
LNIWWCNQTDCWASERKASIVCSSDQMKVLTYRKTVGDVQKGDIVVHYKSPHVVAFSRAKEDARYFNALPDVSVEDYGSGWRFKTEYFDLASPIHRDEFGVDLIPQIVKHYPIDRNGNPRQGYFFPFDRDGLKILCSCVGERLPTWLSKV